MTSRPIGSHRIDFEVRCPLSGPALRVIRVFVETLAREMGFDAESVAQIEMSVDEACSNVWLHAYPDRAGRAKEETRPARASGRYDVMVAIAVDAEAMSISIVDEGIGDEAGPHKGIDSLDEYCRRGGSYHGLGTFIIRSFMDEVEFHYPRECGTVVRMKKYFKEDQAGV